MKLYIFFLIIVFIHSSNILYADNSSVQVKSESDKILDIENAIIIKGIESETDNDIENQDNLIIYDDSFNDLPLPDFKKNYPVKARSERVPDTFIKQLKKQDNRWHNTRHKIRKGENLWTIAKKYNTDYKLIINANHIDNPDLLNPGNTVLVPNKMGIKHKIIKNETLSGIAKKYNVNKNIITAHNNIKNDIILKGKFLFIPDAKEPENNVNRLCLKNNKRSPSLDLADREDENPETLSFAGRTEQSKPKFIWPVKGEITSSFGKRMNPISNKSKFHCGLDIRSEIGTPVRASADGQIIFSGWKKGYGRVVILKHPDGYITVYAHNKKNSVEAGENIHQGDVIALSGMSGAVTGPHLHFEIRKYLTPLNPLRMLE